MHYDNFRWTMRKKGSVGGLEGDVKFEILAIKHILYVNYVLDAVLYWGHI